MGNPLTPLLPLILIALLVVPVLAESTTPVPLLGPKWNRDNLTYAWRADRCDEEAKWIIHAIEQWQEAFNYFSYRQLTPTTSQRGDIWFTCKVTSDEWVGRTTLRLTLDEENFIRVSIALTNQDLGDSTTVLNIILHEVGHALGLGHSSNPRDLMYQYVTGVTYISWDDILSLAALYRVAVATKTVTLVTTITSTRQTMTTATYTSTSLVTTTEIVAIPPTFTMFFDTTFLAWALAIVTLIAVSVFVVMGELRRKTRKTKRTLHRKPKAI